MLLVTAACTNAIFWSGCIVAAGATIRCNKGELVASSRARLRLSAKRSARIGIARVPSMSGLGMRRLGPVAGAVAAVVGIAIVAAPKSSAPQFARRSIHFLPLCPKRKQTRITNVGNPTVNCDSTVNDETLRSRDDVRQDANLGLRALMRARALGLQIYAGTRKKLGFEISG